MSRESTEVRWNQNPLLHLSNKELEAHSKEWAFVVLLFTPPKEGTSLERYLLNKMKWTLESTRCIESLYSVESIQQDGQYLTFLFEAPGVALSSALRLLRLHQHSFHIGAGFGSGYMFDHYQSIDLIQMKSVLQHGNTTEIQVSPSLYCSTSLPHGVGSFRCSPALAQRSGMNYWILKDYRSNLEQSC